MFNDASLGNQKLKNAFNDYRIVFLMNPPLCPLEKSGCVCPPQPMIVTVPRGLEETGVCGNRDLYEGQELSEEIFIFNIQRLSSNHQFQWGSRDCTLSGNFRTSALSTTRLRREDETLKIVLLPTAINWTTKRGRWRPAQQFSACIPVFLQLFCPQNRCQTSI